MDSWRNNFHLLTRSDELADAILNMLEANETSVNIPGVDDRANGEAVVRDGLLADAEFFATLDPDRLEREFDEQVRAANLIFDPNAVATVRYIQDVLDPQAWSGDAAVAFHKQMTHIETFMSQQSDQAAVAAQAAGMMLAVSVQFRESFYDLVDKTIQVCKNEIAEQASAGVTWNSLFLDVVQGVVNLVNGKTIQDLSKWTIDQMIGAARKFTAEPVKGTEPGEIIDGYVESRNRLKRSYEDNLDTIRSWVDSRRKDLDQLRVPLLTPLPAVTDVDSPDFRYEHFLPADSGVTSVDVERERQRYVDEKAKPDGVIARRLGGEG